MLSYFWDRPYRVVARENVSDSSGDAIWLVDHCWTFRDKCEAADQLKSHPGLADRMKTLMGLEENSDSENIVKEVWKYTQESLSGSIKKFRPLGNIFEMLKTTSIKVIIHKINNCKKYFS